MHTLKGNKEHEHHQTNPSPLIVKGCSALRVCHRGTLETMKFPNKFQISPEYVSVIHFNCSLHISVQGSETELYLLFCSI